MTPGTRHILCYHLSHKQLVLARHPVGSSQQDTGSSNVSVVGLVMTGDMSTAFMAVVVVVERDGVNCGLESRSRQSSEMSSHSMGGSCNGCFDK